MPPNVRDIVTNWQLESSQCHVWAASLTADAGEFRELSKMLSSEERQRAERFAFDKDRNAFIQWHGILRTLLGRYLDVRPEEISFSTGPHGKPFLAGTPNQLDLRFNISHSSGKALFAFTRGHEVGVDIECLGRMADWEPVAELMFSACELAELAALVAEDKLSGFFNAWTRKEAVLKATGAGITSGTKHLDVSLTPSMPFRLLGFRGESAPCGEWSLEHLEPAPGFVGAVAVPWPHIQFKRGIWKPWVTG